MRPILRITILCLILASTAQIGFAASRPVTDATSAIRVAEKAMIETYGRKTIDSERPLTAKLDGSVWMVSGSLPPGWEIGGVAEVRIDKLTGKILSVTHGK